MEKSICTDYDVIMTSEFKLKATVRHGGGRSLEKSICTDYDVIMTRLTFRRHMLPAIAAFRGKSLIPKDRRRSSLREERM